MNRVEGKIAVAALKYLMQRPADLVCVSFDTYHGWGGRKVHLGQEPWVESFRRFEYRTLESIAEDVDAEFTLNLLQEASAICNFNSNSVKDDVIQETAH